MKTKLLVAFGILIVVIMGVYVFLRFDFLKSKDFKPDLSKEKNILDLRPSIIAKLQQLVKDGSNGLYVLSIDQINPDIVTSKLDVQNASIRIDTFVMHHLDSLQLLPDDIYTFNFNKLHIDGIGIEDLLKKDRIKITAIHIESPDIKVYHTLRPYNKVKRIKSDSVTLYDRLKGQLKFISINKIDINNATVTNRNTKENKTSKFTAVSILVNDLLIDSSTKNDESRFLFAKKTIITTKNYSMPTKDSMYFFKIKDISISGQDHTVKAQNVELVPRVTRKQFESKLEYNKDMYNFKFTNVTLKNIDWLAIINNEKLVAKHIEISGGIFNDFLDRSVPPDPVISIHNFPHQLLMTIPFKVTVEAIDIRNVNLAYEEYNPNSAQNGIVYFKNINASMHHISNDPAEIKIHPIADFTGKALFMNYAPMNVKFAFDLSKSKTGEFTSDVSIGKLDSATINKLSQPLGLFKLKTGEMQQAKVYIKGNNFNTSGKITMLYNDLHIIPLKKDKADPGTLKKKSFTSLLANVLLIKNKNPNGNDVRQPEFTVVRGHHKNFFNLNWTSVLTGILKTIGIPVSFGIK